MKVTVFMKDNVMYLEEITNDPMQKSVSIGKLFNPNYSHVVFGRVYDMPASAITQWSETLPGVSSYSRYCSFTEHAIEKIKEQNIREHRREIIDKILSL